MVDVMARVGAGAPGPRRQYRSQSLVAPMAFGPAAEAARLASLVATHALRGALGRLYLTRLYRWRFRGGAAERLIIAPQDLRTADPTLAAEIYAGRFTFCGQIVETGGMSPFDLVPPSAAWAHELHGFSWLRHLRASETILSRSNARALVMDWVAASRKWRAAAWTPEVVARRILSWISHSPIVLDGADYASYRRFMRSLGAQTRYLRRAAADTREGMPRLVAAIALTAAGLAMADQGRSLRQSARWLDDELKRQILADGCHIGRNPRLIIELLLDLLPLKQTFAARGLEPPPALVNAVDRMMPMLRFFRHGDGSFALFNGMGATPADALATLLSYDETRGRPVASASHAGYQRIEAAGTLAIVDTGRAPPPGLSEEAHAGCLSFELSSGAARIVVNCGAPAPEAAPRWRALARTTAAHSTLTLEDTSSCRFVSGGGLARLIGTPILSGPEKVANERRREDGAVALAASHDFYMRGFGVIHARLLRLADDGATLEGQDSLLGLPGERDGYALRFHLHPGVEAELEADGRVRLALGNGEVWRFAVEGGGAAIEESVYLAGREGPRASLQIVVEGRIRARPRLAWRFTREG